MIVKDILRVIYSPVKAFESIVKKPDIRGPIIILALVLASAAIEQYIISSKILLTKERMPGNDEWTEPKIPSSWKWSSNGPNGTVSFDNVTYVIGNYSVKSVVSNNTSIWMKITNIGTLNCSGDEGYKRLSFWINWNHQSRAFPSNLTLKLFSMTESQYFELNATNLISKFSGNWSIPVSGVDVGLGSPDWVSSLNPPSWEKITGLEFVLKWASPYRANLTMNIDDLYFVKKSFSFLTTNSFGDSIVSALILRIDPPSTVIGFFLTWITYLGSFFVISSILHQKLGSWRTLFIMIGYTLAIAIVGVLVRAILYLSLPALSFPLSSWPPLTVSDSIRASIIVECFWYSTIAYPLSLIANLGLDIGIVALCAVSIRTLGRLSWKKAAILAAVAYFIKFFLFGFGSMI